MSERNDAIANDAESLRIRRLSNRYATVTLQEFELRTIADALESYFHEVVGVDYDGEELEKLRVRIDELISGLPKLPPVKDA